MVNSWPFPDGNGRNAHLKATPSSEIRLTSIGLIKGHIEEEQFLLNQHNLIIKLVNHLLYKPSFCSSQKIVFASFTSSPKKLRWFQPPPLIPTLSLQHLGPGDWRSGRWAPPRWVAKRRVRSRSSGGSQGLGPDAHRCGDGLKGVIWWGEWVEGRISSRRVCSMESWRVVGVWNKTNDWIDETINYID